ncbi:DUF4388 domain-containing protein [Thermovibrio ammonificans]|jgi:hypothetical protein
MELRGDFTSYSEVLDLLQIISLGKKTGEVNLRSGSESITIRFKDGKIVDFNSNVPVIKRLKERVTSGELPLAEAAKFLLHYTTLWDQGKFNFVEKEVTEGIGSADTLNVMMDFTKEQDELPDSVREVLKENKSFTLSEEAKLPITFDEGTWHMLAYLSKGTPVREVLLTKSESFGKGTQEIEFLLKNRAIKEIERGAQSLEVQTVQESQPSASPVVGQDKLDKIKELLIETMGPMGEFLIDETLEDMDLSQLTTDMVPQFIENLIEKIPEACLVEGESCREKLREMITLILGGGSNES